MNRDQVLQKYSEIIHSNRISKFQELVNFLDEGLGEVMYADIKGIKHECLDILNSLGFQFPRETFYVWKEFYNYLTEKERINGDRIELGTLYFWMGDAVYHQSKRGFGKYYLRAYVEDIGFHGDYLNGGAIHALRARCYLGQKGIDLLDSTLRQITSSSDHAELRSHIRKTSRSDFERLIVALENRFSLEDNEHFFLPLAALKEIIIQIDPLLTTKANRFQSNLLERLCQLLFGSINGFRYKLDERSRLFQIDGIIENSSGHPFLKELGKTIIVEAKQYFSKSRIDRKNIDILAINMARVGASAAFLVTTAELSRPAESEVYYNYLRNGTFILHLSYAEIKQLSEEKVSFPVLIASKVSAVRLNRRL